MRCMKKLTTSEPLVAAMTSATTTATGTPQKSMYDTATVTAVSTPRAPPIFR